MFHPGQCVKLKQQEAKGVVKEVYSNWYDNESPKLVVVVWDIENWVGFFYEHQLQSVEDCVVVPFKSNRL